jgi:crotonobetainyl-CoA:carnitine CoA-transferase CaiB-like acyl-CoA transferase
MADKSVGALDGVKLLDLTHHIAGPFCTRYLADFGADVIKVERPGAGDPTRTQGPFAGDDPHPDKSGVFLYLNMNKRGITLDLKSATGRELLLRLVQWADVLVESFRPRVMPALGLSYETLAEANPRLVMTSISNFGQDGPYRDFEATEIVAFAMGGTMFGTGVQDREPVKYASTVALRQAGLAAAVATVMTLYGAEETGRGSHVDVSIMDTQSGSQDRTVTRLLAHQHTGEVFPRETIGVMTAAGTWPCKDGYINIRAEGLRFPLVLRMMGRLDLLEDPRFSNIDEWSKPENAHLFNHEILLPWLMERTKTEIWQAAQAEHILSGPIYTAEDVLKDEHFRSRGVWAEVDHPVAGSLTYPGRPFIMEATPWQVRRPAPTLGQHSREVYCDLLGCSPQQLAQLYQAGVV